jgi:hypothetical protein
MDSGEADKVESSDALVGWSRGAEIVRLQRRYVVELEPMVQFHRWLDSKRLARQASPCDGRLSYGWIWCMSKGEEKAYPAE